MPGDLLWFHFDGYNVRFQSGLTTLAMSRPLLEWHVCRRVLALPNLACRQGHEAVALATSADRKRVTGVIVHPVSVHDRHEFLEADLVRSDRPRRRLDCDQKNRRQKPVHSG